MSFNVSLSPPLSLSLPLCSYMRKHIRDTCSRGCEHCATGFQELFKSELINCQAASFCNIPRTTMSFNSLKIFLLSLSVQIREDSKKLVVSNAEGPGASDRYGG